MPARGVAPSLLGASRPSTIEEDHDWTRAAAWEELWDRSCCAVGDATLEELVGESAAVTSPAGCVVSVSNAGKTVARFSLGLTGLAASTVFGVTESFNASAGAALRDSGKPGDASESPVGQPSTTDSKSTAGVEPEAARW